MKIYLSVALLFGLVSCFDSNHRTVTGLEGKSLPAFSLTLADSVSAFNTASIPVGKPFVLFCYQPHCPFCRAQTEEIVKNIRELKDIKIYMISSWPYSDVQKFVREYKLDQYANIRVVQDPQGDLNAYFQPKGVPFLAFYDSNKNLKSAFLGKQLVDALKSNIEN